MTFEDFHDQKKFLYSLATLCLERLKAQLHCKLTQNPLVTAYVSTSGLGVRKEP